MLGSWNEREEIYSLLFISLRVIMKSYRGENSTLCTYACLREFELDMQGNVGAKVMTLHVSVYIEFLLRKETPAQHHGDQRRKVRLL